MAGKIKVNVEGIEKEYEAGTLLLTIAQDYEKENQDKPFVARVNGRIRELSKALEEDAQEISFLNATTSIGHKAYTRSAIFMFVKAIHDVVGEEDIEKVKVEFSLGKGYYITAKGNFTVNDELAKQIEERMKELTKEDIPFEKEALSTRKAIELFAENGMVDKEKLFRFRRSSYVNVYTLDGYPDYFYGYMVPSTGYVGCYEVLCYEGGFVLNLPDAKEPNVLSPFVPKTKFFETLMDATKWNNQFGIDTVGDLNNQICSGSMSDLILVQEAQQERRIGEIAREIAKRGNVKFVMIAGPSSSGKTSFSHRLSIQLRTLGFNPHPIAVDDYFVDRDKTPLDENGDYNFECLEAIDVEQFNQDMCDLLSGKTVELPSFNFKIGAREYRGNYQKLEEGDILVIEGIHCLNDKLSYSLPVESKFKIYISALTTLNIDEHNRIPTTDGRLLRRMVRDARTRGASAQRTIQMWPSVRKGEEENIFPYQESADMMFNSSLIYEIAVLKQFAEPLLFNIGPEEPEYDEAKRLLKFLEYFLGITSEKLPNNSIVREFVGGSCFPV